MLLIFYPPGARGDFLASILLDTISQVYNHYMIPTPINYKKVHWAKDLVGVDGWEEIDTSIRIRLNDIEDYLTVAHLWQEKISFGRIPTENILVELVKNESTAKHMDHMFDHIVDFKSLFDVNSVRDTYKKIMNADLDDTRLQQIEHNISLQQRVFITVK